MTLITLMRCPSYAYMEKCLPVTFASFNHSDPLLLLPFFLFSFSFFLPLLLLLLLLISLPPPLTLPLLLREHPESLNSLYKFLHYL